MAGFVAGVWQTFANASNGPSVSILHVGFHENEGLRIAKDMHLHRSCVCDHCGYVRDENHIFAKSS